MSEFEGSSKKKFEEQTIKKMIRYVDIKKFRLNKRLGCLVLLDNRYGQEVKVYRKEVFFSGIRVAGGFKTIGEGLDWIIRTRNKLKK